MHMSDTEKSKKKRKAQYILSDLDVFEVSLVSSPAIGRKYIMTKSADAGVLNEGINTEVDTTNQAGPSPAKLGVTSMHETLQKLLKSAELELDEAYAGALSIVLDPKFKDSVPVELMQDIYKEAGYEVPKETVEVEVIKEVEKIVEVEKSIPPTEPKEEVLKGLSPEAQVIFKEQEAKIERAEKSAAKAFETAEAERNARVTREYIEKAVKYKELPYTAEALGPVLKSIAENLSEDDAKVVLEVFRAGSEAIVTSGQLEEKGVANTGAKGADAAKPEYIVKAEKLVADKQFPTRELAVAHLYKTEPKLFEGV